MRDELSLYLWRNPEDDTPPADEKCMEGKRLCSSQDAFDVVRHFSAVTKIGRQDFRFNAFKLLSESAELSRCS